MKVGTLESHLMGRGSLVPADLCTHGAHAPLLTQLAHFQNLTQHLGQFYTAAAEGTFVLVLPAAVLKHNLCGEEGSGQRRSEKELCD